MKLAHDKVTITPPDCLDAGSRDHHVRAMHAGSRPAQPRRLESVADPRAQFRASETDATFSRRERQDAGPALLQGWDDRIGRSATEEESLGGEPELGCTDIRRARSGA